MRTLILLILSCFSFIGFSQNITDSKGKKQGPWAKTYPGTKVYQYKGEFKDDIPTGTFTYYYQNTKVKAIIKHGAGAKRSEAYFYHDNGKLMSYGIYHDLKKDSIWLTFGPTGKLSNSETYKNDLLNGKKTIYYIPEEFNDKSQIISGISYYTDGKLNGEYTEYFNSTVVRVKGKYVMNKKVGIWETYHYNGKKMMLERFKDGARHGWCSAFDESGKETGKQYFFNGKRLQGKELETKLQYFKQKGIDPNQ